MVLFTLAWSIQKQATKYFVFNRLARHINASDASILSKRIAVKNDMP